MKLIYGTPGPSGAYPPLISGLGERVPGWLEVGDGCDTTPLAEYNGFVTLTVEDGKATSMSPNLEAWEAWKASLPPEAEPGPTAEDVTLELLAEHEERLCMLELTAG